MRKPNENVIRFESYSYRTGCEPTLTAPREGGLFWSVFRQVGKFTGGVLQSGELIGLEGAVLCMACV